jgi:hypothetical protein
MLRSPAKKVSANIRSSVRIEAFMPSFHCGYSSTSLKASSTLRISHHWPAKLSIRATARGSSSRRRACSSTCFLSCSRPWSAASSSSSSGMLLHRK